MSERNRNQEACDNREVNDQDVEGTEKSERGQNRGNSTGRTTTEGGGSRQNTSSRGSMGSDNRGPTGSTTRKKK
jgi:hypothetical protein